MVAMAPEKRGIVICRSFDGGTNALLCKPPNVIAPQFGVGSFDKHAFEASKLCVPCVIYDSKRVSLDIDTPEDIDRLVVENCGIYTRRFLKRFLKQRTRQSTVQMERSARCRA